MTTASAPVLQPSASHESLNFVQRAELLGIAVRFESNSGKVLAQVERFIANHGGTLLSADLPPAPLSVKCIVREQSGRSVIELPQYVSGDGARLTLHAANVSGAVEPAARESIAYVSAAYVDSDDFQSHVLEAITFALIACFDRHPLHASAIVHNGRALLFAGVSGAGKSTLARLGVTAGYKLLAEDRVWVQRDPSLRIWGTSSFIRLADTGERKELLTTERDQRVNWADAASVCILARGAEPRLDLIRQDEVCAELERQLAPGFDRFPERHPAVARALSPHGGWRLTLTNDPGDALPLVRIMLEDHRR